MMTPTPVPNVVPLEAMYPVDPIINDPFTDPDSAVMVPVIIASVAVNSPAAVTRNGADPGVPCPAKNGYVPSLFIPTDVAPVPAYNAVELMVHPPIKPSTELMVPDIAALLAHNVPS